MRVFIAVKAEPFKGEVERLQALLREKVPREAAVLSFSNPENAHLTLKFLGELREEEVEGVKDALRKVSFESFKLRTSTLGVFPRFKKPRVVWLGVDGGDELLKLVKGIEEKLSLPPEKFTPHITLARVKRLFRAEPLKAFLKEEVKGLSMVVESFALFKSVLKPGGAEHVPLEEYRGEPKTF